MTYITETMIYGSMKYQMNRSQMNWMDKSAVAASNLRINNAEDDPDGAAKTAVIKDGLLQMEGMEKVATAVGARINDTLESMTKMVEILNTAINNDIASGNGTLNPEDRKRVASVMSSAQQAFLQEANSTSNGRYLFGGYADNAAPYELDGTYHGDDNVVSLEVAPNLRVNSNVPGSAVVSVAGGQNVLAVLGDLVTALNANDAQGIKTGLTNLHASHDQLTLAVASVGGPQATVEYATKLRDGLKISLQEQRTNLEEANFTSAMSDMMQAGTVMQSAMAVAQQVIRSLNGSLNR